MLILEWVDVLVVPVASFATPVGTMCSVVAWELHQDPGIPGRSVVILRLASATVGVIANFLMTLEEVEEISEEMEELEVRRVGVE